MIDMLIVAVPVLDLQYPPSSPAIIKACVKSAGYTAQTLDLNLLLHDICGADRFMQVQYNFENVSPAVAETDNAIDAFFDNDRDLIKQWVNASITQIVQHDPKWLGISVFSYKSHKSTLALCWALKNLHPDIKIVLGGRGASSYALGPDHLQFKKKLKAFFGAVPVANFAETLLHYGLTDKVIQGDGEQAVVDLLKSDTANNVTGLVSDIDIEAVPFVDFDDYNIGAYHYVNDPILPITGSKGCVRKCTFCDIPVLWPRFKFRSGDHIAQEMIHLYNKHGVRKFYMSDSLVNGSLAAFTDFITTLSEYNTANPNERISWVGQYITRTQSRALDDTYYDLLKASGGEGLTIGVESGSDRVRAHMKKQFTTADIDAELAHFHRRGIVCVLLFFSCYPTETWQDFMDTVQMFIRYQRYCANGTVWKLTLGTPYTHHAQTPLWNMQEQIGLDSDPGSDILWLLKDNPTLTYHERIRRRLILQEVAVALRLPMSRNTAELNQLSDSLKLHQQQIDKYFSKAPVAVYPDKYQLTPYDSVLMPEEIQDLIKTHIDHNPTLIDKILNMHSNILDDIQFDNQSYTTLKWQIT
jgi:radical SAM superfamily enzyme YgiQ (UPF0313 family)